MTYIYSSQEQWDEGSSPSLLNPKTPFYSPRLPVLIFFFELCRRYSTMSMDNILSLDLGYLITSFSAIFISTWALMLRFGHTLIRAGRVIWCLLLDSRWQRFVERITAENSMKWVFRWCPNPESDWGLEKSLEAIRTTSRRKNDHCKWQWSRRDVHQSTSPSAATAQKRFWQLRSKIESYLE